MAEEQWIHERIARQARLNGARPALVSGESVLTYAELDQQARRLAARLVEDGLRPGEPVALFFERGPELLGAICGVLYAGGVWFPLNPVYPAERLRFMLEDAGVRRVLTLAALTGMLPDTGATVLELDRQVDGAEPEGFELVEPDARGLAYIIYTSGSTGQPKGVLCRHAGVLNLLDDAQRRQPLGPEDRCSWWTSHTFDVSVYEIFSALTVGAALYVVPEEIRSEPAVLLDWLETNRISSAYLPPMMTVDLSARLKERGGFHTLRRLLTGVEPIPETVLREIAEAVPGLRIINGYGPTEATCYCTCYTVPGEVPVHDITPIGKPLDHLRVYLLDEGLQPVPDGEPGEICVAGVQVAAGYLNRPELTAERFVPDPDGAGLMYRTGDLAVRLPDGNWMFKGRRDRQLKIFGHRVEPGEIEAAVRLLPKVRDCAVRAWDGEVGEKRLVAYCTAEKALDLPGLRTALRDRLPEYMVPALFVQLDRLPLTLHGKTDFEALPRPTAEDFAQFRSAEYLAPRNPAEERVAAWFESALGVRPGVFDNFFELGGQSLQATRICAALEKEFGRRIPLRRFFEEPTIATLATWVPVISSGDELMAAPDQTLERLRYIWIDLLGVPPEPGVDFLAAGDNSLLAIQLLARVRERFGVTVTAAEFFRKPDFSALAERLGFEPVMAVVESVPQHYAQRKEFPATPEQEDMWLQQKLDPDGVLFNIPQVITLHGPLDPDRLEAALNRLVARHDVLRTGFVVRDNRLFQQILPVEPLRLRREAAEPETVLERTLADGQVPFDLERPPLMRFTLLQCGPADWRLVWTAHHLIIDGWGIGLFLSELAVFYDTLAGKDADPLPPPEFQYGDFALWQRDRMESGAWRDQFEFWRVRLAGLRPLPPLSAIQKESCRHKTGVDGDRFIAWIEAPLTESLQALATERGSSLFMALTAVYQLLLARYSGATEVCSGTAIANHNQPVFDRTLGCFINALALRTDLSGNPSFAELLDRVRDTALDAFDHQDVPYIEVVRQAGGGRPAFRHSLILQNMPMPEEFGDLSMRCDETGNHTAKLDLLVYVEPRPDGLELLIEYSTEFFERAAMERFAADFNGLIRQVVRDPARPIGLLETSRTARTRPDCVIIGETSMAQQCAQSLYDRGWLIRLLITPNAELRRFARKLGISVVAPADKAELCAAVQSAPCDFLFSIVNSYMLPESVLRHPRRMAINWHDAPLPRYAGVHATAWALINGEARHGVSWHEMTVEADAGRLLRQVEVPIEPNDTSFSLNARCYLAGIAEFEALAGQLEAGTEELKPQDLSRRTCYGLHDRPPNGGVIDWSRPRAEIENLCRALDFGKIENPLGLSKVYRDGVFYWADFRHRRLRTLEGAPVEAEWREENDPGFPAVAERLDRLAPELARHEKFWVRRLAALEPLDWPFAEVEEAVELAVESPEKFVAFLVRLTAQAEFDLGLVVDPEVAGFFSDVVPLHVAVNPEASCAEGLAAVRAELAECVRRRTFARDVFPRYPQLDRSPRYRCVLAGPVVRLYTGAADAKRITELYQIFRDGLDETRPLCRQPLLTAEERRRVGEPLCPCPLRPRKGVHQLFEEQAVRTPDAVAVEDAEENQLSYAQLNARAAALALRLRRAGLEPGDPVGLCVNRSLETAVGLLGILKAGGAYVPFDPAYPADRLRFIVEDTGMKWVYAQPDLCGSLGTGQTVQVLHPDGVEADPAPLPFEPDGAAAYILYTSGSTGQPKGVVVEHSNVVNHCLASLRIYGITEQDRVLQFFSINFDGSVEEFFPAWACGATVVLRPESISASVIDFVRFCEERRIRVVDLPTAYWHEWVRVLERDPQALPPALRAVIVGGEKAQPELLRIWMKRAPGVRWFNSYGPTECTVVSTVFEPPPDFAGGELPIGRAIDHTLLYVVDRFMEPVPEGLPGELLIGGVGVAHGYLNRPELTAEKFKANPFGPGRVYRTGDRVSRRADGLLYFEGRVDFQVKIRGFRIEPDEIAAVLRTHPQVADALVAARDDLGPQKQLAAWVVCSEPWPAAQDLLKFLTDRLPEYMVPVAIEILDEFPLTPVGKIDRHALPKPGVVAGEKAEEYVAPVTPEQQLLANIWCDLLKRERVGLNDHFFDLGGHSLLAVQLMDRVSAAGYALGVGDLFQHPGLEAMAARLKRTRVNRPSGDSLVVLRKGEAAHPPLFFLHTTPGDVLMYGSLIRRLPPELPCCGFQSVGLVDPARLHARIEEMAAYYLELLNGFYPRGPVMLCGWCYGGTLAAEMARQLHEQGRTVSLLALFDAWAYPPADRRLWLRVQWRTLRLFGLQPWQRALAVALDKARNRVSAMLRDENVKNELKVEARHGELKERSRVYKANVEAAQRYRARYCPVPIALFRPDLLDAGSLPMLDLGWELLCADVKIFMVPGDHRALMQEPNVQVLARSLEKLIAAAS